MTRITLTEADEARFRLLVAHANTEHAAIARRAFAELDAIRASMAPPIVAEEAA